MRPTLLAMVAVPLSVCPALAFPACTVSMPNVAFGDIDVLQGSSFSTTSAVRITCTGGPANSVGRACVSIETGSASDGTSRLLVGSGADRARYDLFSDAAMTQRWGSYVSGFDGGGVQIDFPFDSAGRANFSRVVYAKFFPSQQTLATGAYSSSFSGSPYMTYTTNLSKSCPTSNFSSGASFSVTANVPATCRLSATTLEFGSVQSLATPVDGSMLLSLQCSRSLPYTVALNGGAAAASDPRARKMVSGTRTITYGLYRDTARTQPWGASVGSDTAAATGTGFGQNLTVFGRIPAQTTPLSGSYSDTVIATVSY